MVYHKIIYVPHLSCYLAAVHSRFKEGRGCQPLKQLRGSHSHLVRSQSRGSKGKVTPNKEDDQLKEVQLSIKQQKGSGGRENIFFNIMQVFELNQVNDKKPPRKVATYKKAKERKRKGQVKVREAFYGSQIEKENYKSN